MSTPYYTDESVTLHHGDALALPLEDATVDLVVTSPPYFGLRSYQDGGEHYAGQIGSEATPAEFVDALIAATREMVRVLKPSGSIWVNLGDRYSGASGGGSGLTALGERLGTGGGQKQDSARMARPAAAGFRPKSLIGVPWRYAIRCIDDLGLILRAEVIWSKPNGLPESVTDRVRRSHETWFHFVKSPRYYSAVDEIREPHGERSNGTPSKVRPWQSDGEVRYGSKSEDRYNALGKLPGSVWTIATQPLTVPASLGIDHFAAFPMEWPRRIITGWSPREVCVACGEGRRPVVAKSLDVRNRNVAPVKHATDPRNEMPSDYYANTEFQGSTLATITGYACACPAPMVEQTLEERGDDGERVTRTVEVPDPSWVNPAPTTPGVVLDPFSGTGTVALMAKVLGRRGIGVDLSADYCRLAQWRVNDPGQIASAMQVEKPETPMDDQGVLDFGASA